MINMKMFRLNKDGSPTKNYCFCMSPELIENYDKAIADESQTWECHHRNERFYTKQELIDLELYYNCPPCELIFLTHKEHMNEYHKGIAQAKKEIGEGKKGIPRSENVKLKISKANKGKKRSDETKQKLSDYYKGKHWRVENGKRIWY